MGIGCRRDPLEANVWYVTAADLGDERAKQRLAAIHAAASGGGSMASGPNDRGSNGKGASPKNNKGKERDRRTLSKSPMRKMGSDNGVEGGKEGNDGEEKERKKRFGLF